MKLEEFLIDRERKEGYKEGFEEGFMEGYKEGYEEGCEEGFRTQTIKNAKKMKELGVDHAIIVQATGLTIKEVDKL